MSDWEFLYSQTQQRLKKRVNEIAHANNISPNLVFKIWMEIQKFKSEENTYYGDACAMSEEAPPIAIQKRHSSRIKA